MDHGVYVVYFAQMQPNKNTHTYTKHKIRKLIAKKWKHNTILRKLKLQIKDITQC